MFAEVFNTYRAIIVFGLSTVLLVVMLVRYWDHVRLWWLNVVYSFPLIGKINRLKKADQMRNQEWYQSEWSLCTDYFRHVKVKSKRDYLECVTYLRKAQDEGRSPVPGFMWVLIVLLVFIEAMGFGYVLAGYAVPGASEATQQTAGIGLAVFVSALLVLATHFTGHELHRSSVIRAARNEWESATAGGEPHELVTNASSLDESLADSSRSQRDDDDEPRYAQTLRRVGTKPGYWITTVTAVFVVIVAIGATYIRGHVLEKERAEETIMDAGSSGGFYDAPAEIAESAKAADKEARSQINEDDISAAWGTFYVLAVIFVFLQIVSVIIGMKWGFAGKSSSGVKKKGAYQLSGGGRFDDYDDLKAYTFDRVANEANSKLHQLRTKMLKYARNNGKTLSFSNLSFDDFAARKQEARWDANRQASAKKHETPAQSESVAKQDKPEDIRRYHYADAQNQPTSETYKLSELQDLLDQGTVNINTNVFEVGGRDWKPLSEFIRQSDVPPPPPVVNIPPPPLAQVSPHPGSESQK